MSEPRRILLTHYDLDGIGCDIILSKLYKFERKYKCGYPKMKKFIEDGNMSGYDSAVVADLSLTKEQFDTISNEYGDKFLYIDHHGPSVDMVNGIENNPSKCFMDKKFSATGITFQLFQKNLPKNMVPFVSAVDAYDCWRHSTHGNAFLTGYSLNILFWELGYNYFFDRFSKNPNVVWTTQEQKIISDHATKRDKALRESDKTPFGDDSLIVLDTPRAYINDYGLVFDEYKTFYLMYTTQEGKLSLSVRTTRKDVNVGKSLNMVGNWNPYVMTCGGHPEAGGMDFNDDADLDVIIDAIESIDRDLNGIVEDVPF